MRALFRASKSVVDAPMPLLPPVTRQTLSFKSITPRKDKKTSFTNCASMTCQMKGTVKKNRKIPLSFSEKLLIGSSSDISYHKIEIDSFRLTLYL